MQGVQTKRVIGYFVLPGVVPRVKNLFASGFGYIAFLMAQIYNMVRLLPNNHPYLNPNNIGKFGIRHVISAAADNLVISRKNIDQIMIFVALLCGMVILGMQIILLIYGYIIQTAMANPGNTGIGSMFATNAPHDDIAFILLDHVFGIPNFFCNGTGNCSSVQATLGANGLPIHQALRGMFRFYSMGLLIVGILIFLYFIVVVVTETAITGTPFGERFQNVWVPIRLVVALGLLIPLHHGLNSGQYIALFAAKAGSGFATNGWIRYNATINEHMAIGANPSGERTEHLVVRPTSPDLTPVVEFMSLVHGCAYSYWHASQGRSNQFVSQQEFYTQPQRYIRAHLVKTPYPWMSNTAQRLELTAGTSYQQALDFYNNSNITIRFGIHDPNRFNRQTGFVEPTCGEMMITIAEVSDSPGGANQIQRFYFDLIKNIWFSSPTSGGGALQIATLAQRYMAKELPSWNVPLSTGGTPREVPIQCLIGCGSGFPCNYIRNENEECTTFLPSAEDRNALIDAYNALLITETNTAWQNYVNNALLTTIDQGILNRGWGGAGLWFNKINQINGSFITAVTSVPMGIKYPIIMEEVRKERLKTESDPGGIDQFNPRIVTEKGEVIALKTAEGGQSTPLEQATAFNSLFQYWHADVANQSYQDKIQTGVIFTDIMNFVFGTEGLMAMRGTNAGVHPLAQLSALGKGLVDSAVRNVAMASFSAAMGGPAALFEKLFGQAAKQASSFMMTTAFIGLTAGLVLFYILPFLPFLYFFFAVGAWVKSIFEAMVGIPLWALAHLRIDGEGLPGDSASNGYFLIFEIFLRPILTIFGLIASTIIFTAQVRVLNFIWAMVVDNLTGFSKNQDNTIFEFYEVVIQRDIVDQFFFTVVYTIIVYMMATASFKLIDSLPDHILRWMGAGVSTFGDINDDPTQGLTRYAAIGGMTFGQKAAEGAVQLGEGIGNIVAKEGGTLQTLGRSGK